MVNPDTRNIEHIARYSNQSKVAEEFVPILFPGDDYIGSKLFPFNKFFPFNVIAGYNDEYDAGTWPWAKHDLDEAGNYSDATSVSSFAGEHSGTGVLEAVRPTDIM